jgi:hypothetical protein
MMFPHSRLVALQMAVADDRVTMMVWLPIPPRSWTLHPHPPEQALAVEGLVLPGCIRTAARNG